VAGGVTSVVGFIHQALGRRGQLGAIRTAPPMAEFVEITKRRITTDKLRKSCLLAFFQ
jgi:hypothetical protein